MGNRNDIHKWCFFVIPDTTVSCCLKHSMKFYSGKYSCGRELQFESYDREGIICSIICSKSAPSNHSEKIDLPLSICLYELKEIGCSCLYSLYYSEKNSDHEHDDINDANETNGESNKQEMHTDTIPIFVLNR